MGDANKMDLRIAELYCKYIIKPLEEKKNKLERELPKMKFWRRPGKREELVLVKKMLNEKLKCLSEMLYEQDENT